jgi:hypothetical protein
MARCGGPLRCFERGRRFLDYRFKRLGSASEDLSVNELPADAFIDKELVYCLCKATFPARAKVGLQSLDEIVDPEPVASTYQRLYFLTNVLVTPVGGIGRPPQYPA